MPVSNVLDAEDGRLFLCNQVEARFVQGKTPVIPDTSELLGYSCSPD